MPGFEYNNLFGKSGPQGMLEYLQSRLAAHDLSAEEALAMISAVHEELKNPGNAGHATYQKYSEFMEALHVEMPEVHDFVVSSWERRSEASSKAKGTSDDNREPVEFEERSTPENGRIDKSQKIASTGSRESFIGEGEEQEGGEGDEPEEEIDSDEKMTEPVEQVSEERNDSDAAESEDEPEGEKESEQEEKAEEENEEAQEEKEDESEEEESEGEEEEHDESEANEEGERESEEARDEEVGEDGEEGNESDEPAEAVEEPEAEGAEPSALPESSDVETEPPEEDAGNESTIE